MTAREAALKALGAYSKGGSWPTAYLHSFADKEMTDRRDIALAETMLIGTLQNLYLIDHYISSFSSIRISQMQRVVLNILRISVYQIAFLDRIPQSAAVDEAVKLARAYCGVKAAGFVNAVLRSICRAFPDLPDVQGGGAGALSVRYSHAEWFVRRLMDILGTQECESFLRADNEPALISLQTNTLLTDTEGLISALIQDGIRAQAHPWLPDCVTIPHGTAVDRLQAFNRGLFYVQDPAARLAAFAAEAYPGAHVLDACSSPGGKSFSCAVDMRNAGEILACDITEKKTALVAQGASRLGIDILNTLCADARVFNKELEGCFDIVIADVPCSGFGVIRKKPEIRYKDSGSISALPDIQTEILKNVSKYVKPGGALVYSTCTVLPEENEQVAERFLSDAGGGFTAEAFTLPGPIGRVDSGMITIFPQRYDTDGFFICRMRRTDR